MLETRQQLAETRTEISAQIEASTGAQHAENARLGELSAQIKASASAQHAENARLGELSAQIEASASAQHAENARLGELSAQIEASAGAQHAENVRLREILRAITDREPAQRERLRELRASERYLAAFVESDPLVSVVIPTYDNPLLLHERAIRSVLAQTYQNFEVVVVGDAAPDDARAAVESFGDARVRYTNLTQRGPYPDDAYARWLVAGVPPYNEAVRLARGSWIAPLDDDDAFQPKHIELLLERAQRDRLELVYGKMLECHPGGGSEVLGRFPPELGQFALQASIYHAGLTHIFELELTDSLFDLPYDWALCQRMLRTGVRMGMVDEICVDYYPSRLWSERAAPSPAAPPEWEYVPEGWERARREDQLCSRGWDVEEVARTYVERWPAFCAAIADGQLGVSHEIHVGGEMPTTSLVAHNMAMALAYVVARTAQGAGALSVLDLGGAIGHQHEIARSTAPDIKFDWHTRELPAVCREGRLVSPLVTFHESDDCFEDRYDLVLASGSLQYAEDWRSLLARLAAATKESLFLTRVPLVQSHPSFVVLQRAQAYGYATEYLGWVFNRSELLECAAAAGLHFEREFFLVETMYVAGAPENPSHGALLFTQTSPSPGER